VPPPFSSSLFLRPYDTYAFVQVEKGVDLATFLKQRRVIPPNFPKKLLQSLQVLQVLLGFTHFDVKTENILVVERDWEQALVFTDFGTSGYGHQIQVPLEANITTLKYTPLDVALGCASASYTQATDMHPIALVLVSLCLGKDVFDFMDENGFTVHEAFISHMKKKWESDESRSHVGDHCNSPRPCIARWS
jgi:serine/threonine protein kinase